MQDKRTNELVPMDLPIKSQEQTIKERMMELQASGIAAGIPKEHQGATFYVNEPLEVAGAQCQVKTIRRRRMTLEPTRPNEFGEVKEGSTLEIKGMKFEVKTARRHRLVLESLKTQ